MSLAAVWEKSFVGGGNSKYKGPEAGVCLDQVSSISALFTLRAGDFFVVGTVLCLVGYLAEPPVCTHSLLAANPTRCDR